MHARRADGRLKASVTVGYSSDGKPIKKSVYARTEAALKRKVEELKLTLKSGTYRDPGRLTVAGFLDMWLEKHVAKLAPNTQAHYRQMVNYMLPYIGAVKVRDLGPLHVEHLLDQYRDRVSGTTLSHIYTALRAAVNKGIRWRMMPADNPCKGVDTPVRSTERPKPYEREEIQQLLRAAQGTPLYCLWLMAIWTGMREGELLGLWWSDVNFDTGWLHISRALKGSRNGEPVFGLPKTPESERDIPLSPLLIQALEQHRSFQQVILRLQAGTKWKDHNLVFTQRNGGPVNPSNLRNRYWYTLLQRAGLRRITFHDLRHTAATVMLSDLGYDVKTVQELLGHSEARTTMDIYGHGRDHKKKEAVRRMDTLLTTSERDTDLGG